MELKVAMITRRSIRKYEPTPIPHEVLVELMETAVTAPSGENLQPWYFVVLESSEEVEKCRELMRTHAEGFRENLKQRFPKHPEVVEATIEYMSTMGGAPVIVLAFIGKPMFNDSGKSSPIVQSVSAAIENLLLIAWDRGIGSCWMTAPIIMGVDKYLEETYAPDHGEFVAAIALGYPAQTPKMPRRREGKIEYK